MTFARVAACLAVLALFGGVIFTQETAQDKGTGKKAVTVPAVAKPATFKVEKKPFRIERTLKGILASAEAAEISYRPYPSVQPPPSQGPLTLRTVAAQGARVKKGEVVAALDTTKIDAVLADLEREKKVLEAGIKLAEEELPLFEKSVPADLAAAEFAKQKADEDLSYFLDVGRAQAVKSADMMLKSAKFYLEYAQEELRQLEKMYKANDLTEETEKIILRRQQNAVEMAAHRYQDAILERDRTMKYTLPNKEKSLKEMQVKQEQSLEKARKTLAPMTAQKRATLAKTRHDLEKNAARLEKLRQDREAMTLRAPLDGIVFHGKFHNGRWALSDAQQGKLVPNGTVMPDEVLLTVVKPRPLVVHLTVEEKDVHLLKQGAKATAKVLADPGCRVTPRMTNLTPWPTSPGKYETVVALETNNDHLLPGMGCEVKFVPYSKKTALLVPTTAVHEEDDRYFVLLVQKDGKAEERTVHPGRDDNGQMEILSGLNEGDEILLERPGAVGSKKGPATEKKEGGGQ
jgi:RND family efflux transporter MFP subunit